MSTAPSVLAFGHPMFGIGEVYLPHGRRRDPRVSPQPVAVVQDVVAAARGGHAGPGPPVLHHRRSRRAHDDDAGRRARRRPRRRAARVPRRGRAQPAPDADAGVDGRRQRHRRRRARRDRHGGHRDVEDRTSRASRTLELRDQMFSPEGVSSRALSSSRGLRAMGELLFNPFEPVVLDRMDVDVRVEYRRDVAEIVGVSLPGGRRARGRHRRRCGSRCAPTPGAEYVETVPVVIPRTWPVRHGQDRGRDRRRRSSPTSPQAESLRGYIDNLRKFYSASPSSSRCRPPTTARRCAGACFGPAAVGAGHAAPGQPDPARRRIPRRRPHRVPRRSGWSAASKS